LKRILLWVPIALLAVAIVSGLWLGRGKVEERAEQPAIAAAPVATAKSEQIQLYFGDRNRVDLVPELRTMSAGEDLQERLQVVVRELAAGSLEGHLAVVPSGVRLRSGYVDGWGDAYLDFTKSILGRGSPGDGTEWLAVAAIVRTICEHFPEIQSVRFLIEGQMIVSLAGYVDLEEPLSAEHFVSPSK